MAVRKMPPIDRRKILEDHVLFGALSVADRETLLTYSRVERYRKGDMIFLKGSTGRGMMAVLQGDVRISAPAADGREVVLNVIGPGEIFGEIALLDGKDRSANAMALSDCEILVLERRDFLPFIEARPGLALQLLAVLCDRLRQTTQQIEDLLFLEVPARLAKQLLEMAAAGGVRTENGFRLDKKIAQRELGQRIGTSRESVNKQLAAWQEQGIVELESGIITICDDTRLHRIAYPL